MRISDSTDTIHQLSSLASCLKAFHCMLFPLFDDLLVLSVGENNSHCPRIPLLMLCCSLCVDVIELEDRGSFF